MAARFEAELSSVELPLEEETLFVDLPLEEDTSSSEEKTYGVDEMGTPKMRRMRRPDYGALHSTRNDDDEASLCLGPLALETGTARDVEGFMNMAHEDMDHMFRNLLHSGRPTEHQQDSRHVSGGANLGKIKRRHEAVHRLIETLPKRIVKYQKIHESLGMRLNHYSAAERIVLEIEDTRRLLLQREDLLKTMVEEGLAMEH